MFNIKLQNSSFSMITCVYTLHIQLHDYINMYKYKFTHNYTQRHVAIANQLCICFITIIAVGVMKSQCEKSVPDELGQFCLTPSQIPMIFNSDEGQWHALAGK